MLSVCGGQHIYRLDHVGMAADEGVNAHVAELLGDLCLLFGLLCLVLCAPVHVGDGVLDTLLLHGGKGGLYFTVEWIRIAGIKGIDESRCRV